MNVLQVRVTANWQATLQYDWIEYKLDVLKFDLLIRCSAKAEREKAMPRHSFKLNLKMKLRQKIALTEN